MSADLNRRRLLAAAGSLTVTFVWPIRALGQGRKRGAAVAQKDADEEGARPPATIKGWLRIEPDGRVVVSSGKVELGQGITIALAQIVAEELDVPVGSVSVGAVDTTTSAEEGVTSRSHSVIESGSSVRAAAAEARAFLLARARIILNCPDAALEVSDGMVLDRETGHRISYSALVAGQEFDRRVSGLAPLRSPATYRVVGKPVPRPDIAARLSAHAGYVQDLRLPDMLHARIVRPSSDQASIKLLSIEPDRAQRMPGVVRIVRQGNFVGVLARREEQAIAAMRVLKQDVRWYEPPVPDLRQLPALLKQAPTKDRTLRDDPGVDVAWATAAHRVDATFSVPHHAHASIGPSCAVAVHREGTLTIWTHSQGPFELRHDIAQLLGMPDAAIRVIHAQGAGCYGQNGADDAALDAALLCLEVPGRPVRVQWMREDEFAWEPKGPPMVIQIRASVSPGGTVTSWDHEYWSGPQAARYGSGETTALLAGWHIPQPRRPFFVQGAAEDLVAREIASPTSLYRFAARRVREHVTKQFAPLRTGEMRGVSAFGQAFAEQSVYHLLARRIDMDPIRFCLGFIDDQRLRDVIEAVRDLAHKPVMPAPDSGPARGRGFAFFFYDKCQARAAAIADVEVDRVTGTVRVVRFFIAIDVGQVINPDGLRNQVEGGVVQALSRTLKEAVKEERGAVASLNWNTYPILTFLEVPEIEIVIINRPDLPPGGAGETQTPVVPAAVANAILDAAGISMRDLPFTPDRVRTALAAETG